MNTEIEEFGEMLAWIVEGCPDREKGLRAARRLRTAVWGLQNKVIAQDEALRNANVTLLTMLGIVTDAPIRKIIRQDIDRTEEVLAIPPMGSNKPA
jgi:hypothetical protein